MDLINRYVYAVTRSFSEKQRADIEKELRANIEDMIEQNEEPEAYEEKVKKVLLELGDPEALADEYRGSKRYLIGPQFYQVYLLLLKIVIGAVFGGISIALFIESLSGANNNISNIVINYFSSLISGISQAFAWTTIAVMIAERYSIMRNNGQISKGNWDLTQLPLVPDKKAAIKLSETVISIIFTTIFYTVFIAIVYTAPSLIAAYVPTGNEVITIPVFNSEVLQGYKIIFGIIFVLSIFKELLKLYYKKWVIELSVIIAILTVISTVLTLVVFFNNSIWNTNFASELSMHLNLTFDFESLWERIKNWFIAVIVLSGSIEITVILFRGIRYDTKKIRDMFRLKY